MGGVGSAQAGEGVVELGGLGAGDCHAGAVFEGGFGHAETQPGGAAEDEDVVGLEFVEVFGGLEGGERRHA